MPQVQCRLVGYFVAICSNSPCEKGGVSSGNIFGEGLSSLTLLVSAIPSLLSAVAPPPTSESFLAPSSFVGFSLPPSGPVDTSGVKGWDSG